MHVATSLDVMRSMRLVREYADELARDEHNPRREQSLRYRMQTVGLLDEEGKPLPDDSVLDSASDRR